MSLTNFMRLASEQQTIDSATRPHRLQSQRSGQKY